jgi:hypothetical protein
MQTIPEQLPDLEVLGSGATALRQEEHAWVWVLDWILPLLTVAVLLTTCILGSAKKEIWIDEAYTLQVITDHSLPHMMHALANAVDGGMPLYYLVAHGWGVVFGTSLLALRLLSSLFVCAGVLLLWHTLRRAYTAWAVSLAVAATSVTSALLLHQNVEARYYGLYFACAALVFALHVRLASTPIPFHRLVLAAMLANAALIVSHPLGVLYSGAAIAGLTLTDYRSGRLRWSLYASLAASWLLLLAWIGPILKVHDLAVPRNWTPIPTMTDVLSSFAFASPCLAFGLFMGTGLLALAPKARNESEVSCNSAPLLYHAFAFLLLPIPVALVSWGNSSLFVVRYFLPSLIGATAMIAYLLDAQLRSVRLNVSLRSAWCVLLAVILAWPLVSMERTRENNFELIDRNMPLDLPVMVVDGNVFLPLTYLTHKPERPYYYPLDWDAALHSRPGATVDYKLLRNAKAAGYSSDRIIDTRQALCLFDRFLVLDDPKLAWFRERIFNNPDYQVEHLGDFTVERQLWLVKRLPNSTQCSEQ